MDMAFSHWSASWPVLLGYAVVAVAHLTGLRRVLASGQAASPGTVSAGPARRDLRREAAVFHVGLLTALLALASPVGYWAAVFIWVRAVQSLMLAFVGPALIVLGARAHGQPAWPATAETGRLKFPGCWPGRWPRPWRSMPSGWAGRCRRSSTSRTPAARPAWPSA
jgi:hypothetical protein